MFVIFYIVLYFRCEGWELKFLRRVIYVIRLILVCRDFIVKVDGEFVVFG